MADPSDPHMPGFSPQVLAMDMELDDLDGLDEKLEKVPSNSGSSRSSLSPPAIQVPQYPLPAAGEIKQTAGTSPLPLQISELLRSPPEEESVMSTFGARTASTCSSPPDGSLATPTTSSQPSPVFAAPKLTPRGPSLLWGGGPSQLSAKRFDRAFNEVVAGTPKLSADQPKTPTAVAPGVLFATAVSNLGIPTTPPLPGQIPAAPASEDGVDGKPVDPALPEPSLFSTHKPWRCPNPGCNKAYRQSNGLKYHQLKGCVSFTAPIDRLAHE